jgi:hypothetical protein
MEGAFWNSRQIICDFYMYKEVKREPEKLFTFLILSRAFLSEDSGLNSSGGL